ncbi:MAG: DUF1697 domain-containing protein [Actinomycetota bacterium]|nr:DUF1697 domain-containing protein [Actinomycetota bacterium]MDH5224853.1 DUF1697 domain-containing protein [Actinomycetota bacterium]MDH5312644.1 DUF1697 domain-containing protein [Actinomycetota bacterium]
MSTYVALLRGINVGGKNLIRMADLKTCFEDAGYHDVVTFIQSGNVVFSSPTVAAATLTERIERMLASSFSYRASVVLRNRSQMRSIVGKAPAGFGADRGSFRSDVIFLMPPLTAKAAMKDVRTRDGVDRAWTGPGVLYFERLASRASQSRMSAIVSLPIYQRLTIRNWNTTTRLLELMEHVQ